MWAKNIKCQWTGNAWKTIICHYLRNWTEQHALGAQFYSHLKIRERLLLRQIVLLKNMRLILCQTIIIIFFFWMRRLFLVETRKTKRNQQYDSKQSSKKKINMRRWERWKIHWLTRSMRHGTLALFLPLNAIVRDQKNFFQSWRIIQN